MPVESYYERGRRHATEALSYNAGELTQSVYPYLYGVLTRVIASEDIGATREIMRGIEDVLDVWRDSFKNGSSS